MVNLENQQRGERESLLLRYFYATIAVPPQRSNESEEALTSVKCKPADKIIPYIENEEKLQGFAADRGRE